VGGRHRVPCRVGSHRLPDPEIGPPSLASGSSDAGPARFAPARPRSNGDAVSVRQLRAKIPVATRRVRRGPSAPSAERAHAGTPISDAPAGPPGTPCSAPNRCARLCPPKRAALTRKPGAPRASTVIGGRARARPRSVSSPQRATARPSRFCDRVESSPDAEPRTALLRSHQRSLEERLAGSVGASGGASCRRTPRRDTSMGDVRTQLSKTSTRASLRSRTPGEYLGPRERRASRRFARFSHFARHGPGVLLRYRA